MRHRDDLSLRLAREHHDYLERYGRALMDAQTVAVLDDDDEAPDATDAEVDRATTRALMAMVGGGDCGGDP